MRFSFGNKKIFIDSCHFLSILLDSSVKHLGESDFKYTSQECDNKLLELVN